MIPDRTTLLLACAIATANLIRPAASVQQALGFAYFVHTLRSFQRTVARRWEM